MPELEEIEITRVLAEELRADKSGALIEQLTTLIHAVFRKPPWHEEHEKSRIHFGLGTGLMRRNAILYVARIKSSGKIAGFIMGLELLGKTEDHRDCTLRSCLEIIASSQTIHHDASHGDVNPSFVDASQSFVGFTETTRTV